MKHKSIPILMTTWLLGSLVPELVAGEAIKKFEFGDTAGTEIQSDVKSEKKSVSNSDSTSKSFSSSSGGGSSSGKSTSSSNGKSTTVTRIKGADGKEKVTVTTSESGKAPKVEVFSGEEYDQKHGGAKRMIDANGAASEAFEKMLKDPNVPETVKDLLRKTRKEANLPSAEQGTDSKHDNDDSEGQNPAKQSAPSQTSNSKKATE